MSNKRETVSKKSAAEFFSEHQQIAGFDNPGKSLFTTIRELVENSLDAAESIHVLPDIELRVEEYSELQHNKLNGIFTGAQPTGLDNEVTEDANENKTSSKKSTSKKNVEMKEKDQMYYIVTCIDNGCGIAEDNIGDMLGRVLSGSKHGVRQTRGKFGLGAKMALIWSKKSSGLPIRIRTAHSTSAASPPEKVSTVSLDIDIFKNEPKILSKKSQVNSEGWRGAEISVTIAGNWSNYRSKVLQYFQQLAVITPYAKLIIDFTCDRDTNKSFRAEFERRSEQMPPIATEVHPHPKSLNNITVANLLQSTRSQSIEKFLSSDLSGVSSSVAARISDTLGISGKVPKTLSSAQIAALLQLLRDEKQIRPPITTCLSPAGEYNMRLGVLKELKPKMVATFSDKAGSHEGHPFLVEAAISLGGTQLREGINVYRFANRIPLLFEAGADVVTQVATKRINWASYHIDAKKDSIGVYVSIVSTKVPFKGTSKEYVGDDVKEIQVSVRKALQGCCQQLRVNLAKSLAQKEEQERRKTLVKYIPTIAKSLMTVLEKMQVKDAAVSLSTSSSSSAKRKQPDSVSDVVAGGRKHSKILASLSSKENKMSVEALSELLLKGVDKFESDAVLHASFTGGEDKDASASDRVPFFLVPQNHLSPEDIPLPSEAVIQGFSRQNSATTGVLSQLSDISLTQTDACDVTDLTVERKSGSRGASAAHRSTSSSSTDKQGTVRWLRIAGGAQPMDGVAPCNGYVLVNC